MAVDANLITTTVMTDAQVREAQFTLLFEESIKKLTEALGVTRKIPMQAGTTLKTYKASGTLQSGTVAEGEVIPLSKYKVSPITYKEIALSKFRKATTIEAIQKYGFKQAVNMTNDRMLKDIQKGIRKDFFDFLATGKGKATGTNFQGALAQAWGQLQVLFEDDEAQAVYFMNQLDVADYLATANVTTQTAFGMTYIKDFLGLGTVILNSSVPKGKIYATASNNIVLYYVPVNSSDIGEAFSFTTDETGLVGIHETPDYDTTTAITTVVDGIALFAERIDGVVIASITPPATQTAGKETQ